MKYLFLFSWAWGMILAQTPPPSLRVSMIALPWDVQPGTSWPAPWRSFSRWRKSALRTISWLREAAVS